MHDLTGTGPPFYGVVTVGERGQIVIPAEARREHGIEHADKLLVCGHPHGHGIVVLKVSDMESMVSALQELLAQADKGELAPEA